jgi:hypothetical protein
MALFPMILPPFFFFFLADTTQDILYLSLNPPPFFFFFFFFAQTTPDIFSLSHLIVCSLFFSWQRICISLLSCGLAISLYGIY